MSVNTQMHRKICLVTGATSGIGKAACFELARRGAAVVLTGRNRQKCIDTVQQIEQDTGSSEVSYLVADLSSQAEVRQLADQFKARFQQLHVLINNAGAFILKREESADGFEMTFALNHLGYFLLTNLLLDRLIAGAPSRVINVSSGAHLGEQIDFNDLQGKRRYNGMRAYGRSKLANLLFTYELARRLEGSGVTVNALHPGFVASGFGLNNHGLARVVLKILHRFFAISPEKGAETAVFLATAPEVEGVTGKYFYQKRETRSSPASYDLEAARRLWQISEELTGLNRTGPGTD